MSVGQRSQHRGQPRVAGLVGIDDVLLLGDTGAQRPDQGPLARRGARQRGQTGGVGRGAVHHRPEPPPRKVDASRIAHRGTQPTVGTRRGIQDLHGIAGERGVVGRQGPSQPAHLPSSAPQPLPGTGQAPTGIHRYPTRRRPTEQRVRPAQNLWTW